MPLKKLAKQSVKFIFTLLAILFFSSLPADEFSFDDLNSSEKDPIRFELVSETHSIQPGVPFWVALHLEIDDHWHAYWKHPGDIGMPTRVEWALPEGFEISDIEWPFPKKFEQSGFIGFGFEKQVTLLAQISPPNDLKSPEFSMEADIRWLVCSDSTCLPGQTALSLSLPISNETPGLNESQIIFFKNARNLLPKENPTSEAYSSSEQIDLIIQPEDDIAYHSAYFFPETKDLIDAKAAVSLTPISEQPGKYRVLLKTQKDSTLKSSFLKGVLVIESKEGLTAIALDLPLQPNLEVVALAEVEPLAKMPTRVVTPHLPPEPLSFDGGVGLALFLAFIGGAILNLMPCVLPVLSIKVLSFVKMAGESKSLILKHGLIFSAGVLCSFWVLAGMMLALQSYGQSIGWGFQLQEPLFVGALAALLFLFALSLFGVFEMGTSVTAWAGQANTKSSSLTGSFFSGVLATAVATPCTGPFLGSAIGFAVTLPTFWALLIFTSLGLGMASPYLLLAAFPSLLRFMPKPGAWMDTFKEVLGFVMMATVLWLIWVFSAQTNSIALYMLLISLFLLSLAGWIYGRWGTVFKKAATRVICYAVTLALLSFAGYTIVMATSKAVLGDDTVAMQTSSNGWEAFSAERVEELNLAGIPVLIDFTAKWCLICQANHLVLSVDDVEEAINRLGVVKMKADWTKNDPAITKALKQFGRSGVPLYVLYGQNPLEQPTILPQVLTPDIVLDHLNNLDSSIAGR